MSTTTIQTVFLVTIPGSLAARASVLADLQQTDVVQLINSLLEGEITTLEHRVKTLREYCRQHAHTPKTFLNGAPELGIKTPVTSSDILNKLNEYTL